MRLEKYSEDIANLVIRYAEDIKNDPLLSHVMDVEIVSLKLNQMATEMVNQYIDKDFSIDF
ncbi:hypothetical protein V757_12565 [Pelistega indica]|uniref:Uncharacterized protein n=1 Tax=Pelistega indica TaxID=1414851 RepID=V8FS77_9BURK|nr:MULTISPECIES: hypothetical protein [Pelistega]ETD66548.1 hypothetical protein V757_12565 [Pelistega indica]